MYILYITTNIITGRIYIGVHNNQSDNPFIFDGYLGSGDWKTKNNNINGKYSLYEEIRKYGKNNFIRETLFYFDTEDDAYKKEAEIVTVDFIKYTWNYNLIVGGGNPPKHKGFMWINDGKNEKRILKHTPIPSSFIRGRLPVKESTKIKKREISLINKNKPPIHSKENGYWNKERQDKQRIILSKNRRLIKWSDERKKKFSNIQSGKNNGMYGSTYIWITDGIVDKRWNGSVNDIPTNFIIGKTKGKGSRKTI